MAEVFMGEDLAAMIGMVDGFKHRNDVEILNRYLDVSTNGVACILYGLRRTGKTTMMLHAAGNLSDEEFSKTAFILVEDGDDVTDMVSMMRGMLRNGIRNFFVDEVTRLPDFVKRSSVFADIFASYGSHIVLAGTDSLKFQLAGSRLLGRKFTIHTTRIPFAEQQKLMSDMTFSEYAKYGGILSGDSILKGFSQNKSPELMKTYTCSAIAENVQHSLESYDYIYPSQLRNLCVERNMVGPLNFCAHHDTHELLLEKYNKDFKSEEVVEFISVVRKMLEDGLLEGCGMSKEELNREQADALAIRSPKKRGFHLTQEILDEAMSFFREIEMLERGNRCHYKNGKTNWIQVDIFTQPGVRWSQVETFLSILRERNGMVGSPVPENVISKIGDRAHGKTFEEALFLEVMEACGERCDVFKFVWEPEFENGNERKEIDIIVAIPGRCGFCAFEVKRHSKIGKNDAKHLRDKNLIGLLENEFGSMLDSAVICPIEANSGIHRNVDEFVLNLSTLPDRMLEMAEGLHPRM